MNALWALQGIVWWKTTLNNSDALDLLMQQQELNFQPETRHLYSNSNYIILAELVGKLRGLSFAEFTGKWFQEMGMKHSVFLADHRQISEEIAQPYFNFGKWTKHDWTSDLYGDGALFSTLQDQLLWEKIIQGKGADRLAETVRTQSQQVIAGSDFQDYGYGLEFGTYRDLPWRFHNGHTGGWNASTVRFPEQELSIVVLSNNSRMSPFWFAKKVARKLIDIPPAQDFLLRPEQLGKKIKVTDVIGTYKTQWGYYCKVAQKDDGFYLQRQERNDIKMLPEADNLFQQSDDSTFKQHFSLDENGQLQITFYHTSHPPYSFTKIDNNKLPETLTDLDGKWVNQETGGIIKLKYQKEDQYAVTIRKKSGNARMYAPDVLLLNDYRLDVIRDEAGLPVKLSLFDSRLQAVIFERI
ncbi:MAG: serine hydrolase domain-containing protein [Bacteroidota bacterium]